MSEEFPTDGWDVDLFGLPIEPEAETRGRKAFEKTEENQQLVIAYRVAGHPQSEIAELLGVDEKTLRKYFSRELESASALIEGLAIKMLIKRAAEGHVAAAKALADHGKKGRAAPPVPKPKPAIEKPVGKKETLRRRAASPGDDWSFLGDPDAPLN